MTNEEETQDAEVTPEAEPEAKPKKAKKPRKPRKPKAEAAEPDAEEDDDTFFRKDEQYVRQDGKTVTLSGKGVTLNGLSKADIKQWGVESISGTIGKPCKEPLTVTFKNRKAALDFFNACLENESEDDEVISASSAVKWFSEELGF